MASNITNTYCMGVTVTTENSTTTMNYDLINVNTLNFRVGSQTALVLDNPTLIKDLYDALTVAYSRVGNPVPPENPNT